MKKIKNEPKYKLGVALSGGGVRGFAHLGALQAMSERNLHPEIISGTSVGSLVGAFYADGYTPAEIYAIFRSVKFKDLVVTAIPHNGFFKSTGIQTIAKKHLRAHTFEELNMPLRVVASDIEYGKARIFSEGDLIPALAASCSVPVVFMPIEIDNHYYVDGGMFMNFPVSIIREECDKLIGIDISPIVTMKYDRSFKYIIERTMNYMVGANTLEERELCDYLIESSEVSKYSLFDMSYNEEIYNKGYESASKYLDENRDRLKKDFEEKTKPLNLMERIINYLR